MSSVSSVHFLCCCHSDTVISSFVIDPFCICKNPVRNSVKCNRSINLISLAVTPQPFYNRYGKVFTWSLWYHINARLKHSECNIDIGWYSLSVPLKYVLRSFGITTVTSDSCPSHLDVHMWYTSTKGESNMYWSYGTFHIDYLFLKAGGKAFDQQMNIPTAAGQ